MTPISCQQCNGRTPYRIRPDRHFECTNCGGRLNPADIDPDGHEVWGVETDGTLCYVTSPGHSLENFMQAAEEYLTADTCPNPEYARQSSVTNMWEYIDEYTEANQLNHDPTRNRRLLLHRSEIRKLTQRMQKEQGSTLVPLEIYFKRGYAKVLLGVARGKKLYDKRAAIKARDDKRNMDKALRRR